MPVINGLLNDLEDCQEGKLGSEIKGALELMDSLVREVVLSQILFLEVEHINNMLQIGIGQNSIVSVFAQESLIKESLEVFLFLSSKVSTDRGLSGSLTVLLSHVIVI